MITKLKAPLSVISIYNHKKKLFWPAKIIWEGQEQGVSKIGYHHTHYRGRDLLHTYSVMANGQYFKISFNTKNLNWEIEEINDGTS